MHRLELIFKRPEDKQAKNALLFGANDVAIEPKASTLIFKHRRADSTRADLVFGQQGGSANAVDQTALVTLDVVLPSLCVAAQIAYATPAVAAISLSALQGDLRLKWNSNTWRPVVAKRAALIQQAQALSGTTSINWQASMRYMPPITASMQQGQALQADSALRWQSTDKQACISLARQQHGMKTVVDGTLLWQSATAIDTGRIAKLQQGKKQGQIAEFIWQSGAAGTIHSSSLSQQGSVLSQGWGAPAHTGLPVYLDYAVRWQQAGKPLSGIWRVYPKNPSDVCYTPPRGDDVQLLFIDERAGSNLLFRCRKWSNPSVPPTTHPLLIIPRLDIYMHLHNMQATLWPSGESVAIYDATISTDDGGYAWQLNASGAVCLMEQLAPVNGQPCKIRIDIDGLAWIFAIGARSRSRQWPNHSVSITGASTTSLLDAPHMPLETFSNQQQRSAQQLVGEALEFTGTTIDWQLPDWIVPAGVFNHQGSALSAALRVADAVGAIVQSDRTGQTLRYLPRYPTLPWDWNSATPKVSLPAAYVATDALQEQFVPAYNAIYTAGTTAGVVRRTTRAGTAGDVLAQMVVEPLLTDSIAHTERAKAELGKAGHQADVTLTLPINTATGHAGLLDINDLIEVRDTDQTWRGLVRAISISASGNSPVVQQTAKVERHFA